MLKNIWQDLTSRFTGDQETVDRLWAELSGQYSAVNRHYHNLDHLAYMIEKANQFKDHIEDFETFLFSIFYHDIIYDVLRQDNESLSALKARECLVKLGVPNEKINKCQQQILATKDHKNSPDKDTDFLLDIDLAVLGEEWSVYEQYMKKIRDEYAIFPDSIYNPGRQKVLKHFLDMPEIFKTPEFRYKYEDQVKANLGKELAVLENEIKHPK